MFQSVVGDDHVDRVIFEFRKTILAANAFRNRGMPRCQDRFDAGSGTTIEIGDHPAATAPKIENAVATAHVFAEEIRHDRSSTTGRPQLPFGIGRALCVSIVR
jgi:hypothetical protein